MQVIPGEIKNAVAHVGQNLMPLNRLALESLLEEIEQSDSVDIDSIILKIKSDVGILAHCLQRLANALELEGADCPRDLDLVSYLRWAGEEYLVPALHSIAKERSVPSVKRASSEQLNEITKTVISANTTEILADKFRHSVDQGYTLAVVRQLGYLLISWNYPSTFRACLNRIKVDPRKALDTEIQSVLGFSPAILSGALLQKWGLVEAARFALSPEVSFLEDPDRPSLLELCKIGEAFAEARCGERGEDGFKKLDSSISTIKDLIGSDGMHFLEQRIGESISPYADASPAFFKKWSEQESESSSTPSSSSPESHPRIISLCQTSLRVLLEDLYEKLSADHLKSDNILFFAKQIVPAAGFLGGCAYTLDPVMNQLCPQGKIGSKIARDPRTIALPDKSSDYGSNQLIKSLWDGTAELSTLITPDGMAMSCFSGPLGRDTRFGVLYLEIPNSEHVKAPNVHQVHFHALCEALTDCLSA